MNRRKGYNFPEATIHSSIVHGVWHDFNVLFYEHYGTLFMREIE